LHTTKPIPNADFRINIKEKYKTETTVQLEKFPEQFSIDELIEKLILIEKIESGNKKSEKGQVITEAKLDEEIEQWFE